MGLKLENAEQIIETLQKHLPDARIKNVVSSVTATIQGPFAGSILKEIIHEVVFFNCDFSIYRSGTGLTIKFV
jgi:hypothetical protein